SRSTIESVCSTVVSVSDSEDGGIRSSVVVAGGGVIGGGVIGSVAGVDITETGTSCRGYC
ncbi:hypothetical protein Tco_1414527, partial [Tanacetum coccineum]